MRSFMLVLGLLLGASPLAAQDDPAAQAANSREHAGAARQKCADLIQAIDGISSIGMGGAGSDYRLLIVARDLTAKSAARARLGGEDFEGLKILWSVKETSTDAPRALAPAPAPEKVSDTPVEQRVRSRFATPSVYTPDSSPTEVWPRGWTRPWIVWTHTDRGWEVRRNHFYLLDGTGYRPYR